MLEKGALLFRGLDAVIKDNTMFSNLIDFIGTKFPYTAGFATRKEIPNAPGVAPASDDPPETTIEPHLEMSYTKQMPGKILFYCNSAPTCDGGQTPICDMRKVYKDMVQFKQLLQPLFMDGLHYSRFDRYQ